MNILITVKNPQTMRLIEAVADELHLHAYTATDEEAARSILESNTIDLLVSSFSPSRPADHGGFERLANDPIKTAAFHIAVIPENAADAVFQRLENGADDCIREPLNAQEMNTRIRIGQRVVSLEKELRQRYRLIKTSYYQTIHTFANLLEAFNEDLGGHARRVANLSMELARRHAKIPEDMYQAVEAAGLLHDIGMLGLPGEILNKKRTEMTLDERQLYQSHPEKGAKIINEIELLRPVAEVIRSHHEQYNGKGFPDGLSGHEIAPAAQIVAAASIYDNMVHRGKISFADMPEKLQQMKGFQLDPLIVDLVLEINRKIQDAEKKKDSLEIQLDEMREGMMLAKDIRKTTGALLMPARTELTQYGIDKLHNYYSLGLIDRKIHIYKFSVRD